MQTTAVTASDNNIANAAGAGVEASFALRTRRGLEARASYTSAATRACRRPRARRCPGALLVGDQLLRRPRHQVNVDLLWRHRYATAYVRAGGRSQVLDVEPNWGAAGGLFHAPGFGVADAGVTVHAGRYADVLLRADNLFGRRYEAVFGYPAPRRSSPWEWRIAAGR